MKYRIIPIIFIALFLFIGFSIIFSDTAEASIHPDWFRLDNFDNYLLGDKSGSWGAFEWETVQGQDGLIRGDPTPGGDKWLLLGTRGIVDTHTLNTDTETIWFRNKGLPRVGYYVYLTTAASANVNQDYYTWFDWFDGSGQIIVRMRIRSRHSSYWRAYIGGTPQGFPSRSTTIEYHNGNDWVELYRKSQPWSNFHIHTGWIAWEYVTGNVVLYKAYDEYGNLLASAYNTGYDISNNKRGDFESRDMRIFGAEHGGHARIYEYGWTNEQHHYVGPEDPGYDPYDLIPYIGTPTPANNSFNQPLELDWSVPIGQSLGISFDYTIVCSNGQVASETSATDGDKTISLTNLNYGTEYTVTVTATCFGQMIQRWFTFQTEPDPDPYPEDPDTLSGESDFAPLMMTSALRVWVYNESDMSHQIPFSIEIHNQDMTQSYVADSGNIPTWVYLLTELLPVGEDTIFIVSSPGYKTRQYLMDIEVDGYYNFSFYLPPAKTTEPSDDDGLGMDCYERTRFDKAAVVGTGNQVVTLTHDAKDVLSVLIYDSGETTRTVTSFVVDSVTNPSMVKQVALGHLPSRIIMVQKFNTTGWSFVPHTNINWNTNSPQITIDAGALDDDTTQVRVDFEYEELDYGFGSWEAVATADYQLTSPNQVTVSSSAYAGKDTYTLTQVEYTYEHCEGITQDTLAYIISVLGPRDTYSSSPIEDVLVQFLRYNEFTDQWVEVFSGKSDGEGQLTVFLVPGAYYRVRLSKEYHLTTVSSYIPVADVRTKSFRIAPHLDIILGYSFFDIINVEPGWWDDGFYVIYNDTTETTDNVYFYVYNYTGGELIYNTSATNSWYNFTFTGDKNNSYLWEIIAELSDEDDEYTGTYSSGKIPVFGFGSEPIYDADALADILEFILGPSPIYYDPALFGGEDGREEASVSWVYIVIFTICFIWIATLGKLNSLIGGVGVGLILLFSGASLHITTLFSGYSWWHGASLAVVGVFVIIISIVGMLGGLDK